MLLLMLFAVKLVVVLAFCGSFTNPPPRTSSNSSPSYVNGSIVSVTWNSDLEWVALVMFPTNGGSFQYLAPYSNNISNAGVFSWLVGSYTNITYGLLAIYNPGDSNALFFSDYFSIVFQPSSMSATSTATSTSAAPSTSKTSFISTTTSIFITSIAIASSITSISAATSIGINSTFTSIATVTSIIIAMSSMSIPAVTQSATVTQWSTPSSGLSAATTARISVGVGFGFILLLGLCIFIGWKLYKKRSPQVGSRDGNGFVVEIGGNGPIEMPS